MNCMKVQFESGNIFNMSNSAAGTTNSTRRSEVILEMETLGQYREPPPPYSPPNTVLTNQPMVYQTVIIQPHLKNKPILFTCPNCQKQEMTKVKYVNSISTHMLSGFICGFTIWCMLCCLAAIPYLISSFKKAEHYCANCDFFLGSP